MSSRLKDIHNDRFNDGISSKIVQQATRERRRLIDQLQEIDRFLAMCELFSQEGTGEDSTTPPQSRESILDAARRAVRHPERQVENNAHSVLKVDADILSSVEDILCSASAPIRCVHLAGIIQQRGVLIPGPDEGAYLAALPQKQPSRFRYIPRKGYRMARE